MKKDKTPIERVMVAWDSLSDSDRILVANAAEVGGVLADGSHALMRNKSLRIVFTIAALLGYCLIIYLAPDAPRVMVVGAIVLSIGLTLLAIGAWLFHNDRS